MRLKIGDKVRIIHRDDVIGYSGSYISSMLEFVGVETYIIGAHEYVPSRLYLNITGNNGIFWRKEWLEKVRR